jgi:HK97 family phage prohead protease
MPKPVTTNVERRVISNNFRVTRDAGKPKIAGYAAMFGVRSEDFGGWCEVISPDAFDACLATNPDVRALFNHDPSLILGRTASGTLTLTKDATGLGYEIDPPDTQTARDLLVSMDRGDISQSSFGFICRNASWGYDEVSGIEIRTIKQADLFDVSPVTFPATTSTTSGLRSLPNDAPAEVRSRVAAVKHEHRAEPNQNGCECDCEECVDNDCDNCSNPDCVDPNCLANRSLRSAEAEADANRRMAIRVGFATC